jgi:CBS domain-containing protein
MKIKDVMTRAVETVRPDQSLQDAAAKMKSLDVGPMPVTEGDRLVGMLTDRDIVVRAVAEGKDPRGMPVAEVSSRELVTVDPDQDLSDALQLMAQHQVRRLPVVDEDNHLLGVVSQADVAREVKDKAAGELLEEISRPPTGPRTT